MKGVFTALISPFLSDGSLDLPSYRKILEDQAAAKVTGVVPCGTTGESPTLSSSEKQTLIKTALEVLKGTGIKVLAGTGANNTAETIQLSKWASDQGVDGLLVVTPYYNKPSQAGMIEHFHAVANAVNCELMLYNVPGRTGVSLSPETISKLAEHPRIRSLKEATGDVALTCEILDVLGKKKQKLDILSGDDATYLPLLSIGAVGVVSVASNLFPREMVALQNAMAAGSCPMRWPSTSVSIPCSVTFSSTPIRFRSNTPCTSAAGARPDSGCRSSGWAPLKPKSFAPAWQGAGYEQVFRRSTGL